MSRLSLLTQIGMITIAVVIALTYIKPTITGIRTTQDATRQYESESNKVLQINNLLATQVAKVDSVPPPDMRALERYLPDSVDEVAVMKDLMAILTSVDAQNVDVSFAAANLDTSSVDGAGTGLAEYSFTVKADATYDDMKALLAAIEINDYLLQIKSFSAEPSDTGYLAISLELVVFSRVPTLAVEPVTP
jgi:hypothetical protein